MATATRSRPRTAGREIELATFYVADVLLGIDLLQVEEINKQLDITTVPLSPPSVRGVVNLRGDVVTVIDLRTRLGMEQVEMTGQNRNVVVNYQGERVGLLVDRIADVVTARDEQIEPSPANVSGVDGRFFTGICKLESDLLVILDVEQVLNTEDADSAK